MELDIGVTPSVASLESRFSSDPSSGYLEDAITGWGIWCKHQNSPSSSQDQKVRLLKYNTQYLDDQADLFSSCSSTRNQLHDEGQWKKIAYPFEMVKPGGVEGETTLKDINHQMLMSPSKPIPHPVGDSATHPCISARGLGMSGKAVVALARIQTQGRGSIIIIRTKG